MPARVNTMAGGTPGQDQAGRAVAGRASAAGGASAKARASDRSDTSNAARNAPDGQPTATPRAAQGRRQPAETPGGGAPARTRQGVRTAAGADLAGKQNASGASTRRTETTQGAQVDETRSRKPGNTGRNVGSRLDVVGS